jgi:hypothetical protein
MAPPSRAGAAYVGPSLQVAILADEPAPDPAAVEVVAERLRKWFAALSA